MENVLRTRQIVNIGQILDRLQHVRKTSRGWTALCPAHPDRSPSLSIAEGRDGRALVRCWAGCTFQEIARALGFDPRDLSPGLPRPRTQEERRAAAEQARQREQERALERWSDAAYVRLIPLRRCLWLVLDGPDDLRSDWCTLLDFSDIILDELQYGNLADKLAVFRAARALGRLRRRPTTFFPG